MVDQKQNSLMKYLLGNWKRFLFLGMLASAITCLAIFLYLRPWAWKTFDHLQDENAPFTKTVELRKTQEGFQLYREGKPFYVKGAGGNQFMNKLASSGGNTIRTWSTIKLDSILDEAHKNGLYVIAGLNMIPARFGFDYKDQHIVETQLQRLRRDVIRYKDHPALLMWGVGNELELDATEDNVYIWRAVNSVCKMIHEVDPNHPTTTMIMPDAARTRAIAEEAPEIDVLSFNVFGGLKGFPEKMRQFWWGWNGPYIISEWGPLGWWEVRYTQWNVPLDMHSKMKMNKMSDLYDSSIALDEEYCLGSCVFFWGNKQERTHFWFSMFTESGEKTPMVDLMQHKWTGKWPENRAPLLDSMMINQDLGERNDTYLHIGDTYEASVSGYDFEGDTLKYVWEIMPEGDYQYSTGGDMEYRPEPIKGLISKMDGNSISFRPPEKPGAYRLFVYAFDQVESVAVADRVFFVTENTIN
ncbi:MAG: glycoside hydrolase family 2 TIM barrel-domain containing protein [Bacteroidota bacterium]